MDSNVEANILALTSLPAITAEQTNQLNSLLLIKQEHQSNLIGQLTSQLEVQSQQIANLTQQFLEIKTAETVNLILNSEEYDSSSTATQESANESDYSTTTEDSTSSKRKSGNSLKNNGKKPKINPTDKPTVSSLTTNSAAAKPSTSKTGNLESSASNKSDNFTVVAGRRRNNNPKSSQPTKQTNITTQNRFSPLAKSSDNPKATTSSGDTPVKKVRAPPPVYLHAKDSYTRVSRELTKLNINCTKIQNLANAVKFQPTAIPDYRALIKLLENLTLPFHSFQLPEEKVLKVVLRGVNEYIEEKDIKSELENLNFPVLKVKRLIFNDTPSPLVAVELTRSEEGKSIYNLKSLFHQLIRVEAKRKAGEITQCYNCLRYGHSAALCRAPVVCFKCSGDHVPAQCPKEPAATPKCANCQGKHTASYRGCPTFLQIKEKLEAKKSNNQRVSKKPNSGTSYANVTGTNTSTPPSASPTSQVNNQPHQSKPKPAQTNNTKANTIDDSIILSILSKYDLTRLLPVITTSLQKLLSAKNGSELLGIIISALSQVLAVINGGQ